MQVRALLAVRGLVVFALFPALAGCVSTQAEPLERGVLAPEEPQELAVAWAAIEEATIRPGATIRTEKRDCPGSFIFQRPDNGRIFIGTTAWCVRDLPIGSMAAIGPENEIGVLIYSSYVSMEEVGETDPHAREYNDLALFHIDSSAALRANPTLPSVGGPTASADGDAFAPGARLRAFSRLGELPAQTEWRESVVTGRAGDWALLAYSLPPVVPGATGGAVIDHEGRGVGVVVSLGLVPNPGATAIARLDSLMAYARDHAGLPVELATAP